MEVIFHVGPHKTGTTAIQHFLQRHVEFLRDSGIHVPKPLSADAGHHEIPWALLGWDLRLIESESTGISLEIYFEEVLNNAISAGCTSIIFSSEDFSLLNLHHWNILLTKIASKASSTEPVLFKIVSVYRDIDQYIASQYKTLVLLGLPKKFRKVKNKIKSHFFETHNHIRALPNSLNHVIKVVEIDYVTIGLMTIFWNSIFSTLEIPEDNFMEDRINSSLDDQVIEEIRQGNLEAGLVFNRNLLLHWASFHSLSSSLSLRERRGKVFADRESNVAGQDSPVVCNSQRITKPYRALGQRLQRRK
jgi:hypothetical protein